jgi:hypothetical protein
MNDFTYDELNIILLEMNIIIHRTTKQGIMKISPIFFELRDKVQRMIDSYCDHEWSCWDDVHNTRECTKCNEKHQGEL